MRLHAQQLLVSKGKVDEMSRRNSDTSARLGLCAVLILSSASACSHEDSGGSSASRPPPIGAANEVSASSPLAEGQWAFLYETWGTEQLDGWPPAEFMIGLQKSEPAVFGDQFAEFGFVRDPNDDLPVGFKRGTSDRTKVHETCALCHVGKLDDGRVWFGMPNTHLDMGRFNVEVNQRWVAAGHAPLHSDVDLAKLAACGPGRIQAEADEYPQLIPADFPSYMQLGKRSHFSYLGSGRNLRTETFFSVYAFGAGSPNDATAKVPFPSDARLATFVDFFGQLSVPTGPTPDPTLVTKGKAVFAAARCDACHHPDDPSLDDVVSVDPKDRLPGVDPAFPRGSIGTDALHRKIQDGASTALNSKYDDVIGFIVEHDLKTGGTDGYRTTPLAGVWATAPYLHNGSVPTLEDLLRPPADRPKKWTHDGFDVDTSVEGNGAQGHAFGTDLSADDQTALLAYLRSL